VRGRSPSARSIRDPATRVTAIITIALLVVSHWLLDYIPSARHAAHAERRAPGPRALELAAGTLAAEFAIFAIGLLLYLGETAPRDRIGSVGLWSLVASWWWYLAASSLRRLRL
jgi:hypothetical protein